MRGQHHTPPQLNGLAKRMNMTIMKMTRCMLEEKKISHTF